ncbi:MAG: FkbM family methyltransferase [Deltaproteobacteria bacterium]|nr:FkbM family methyltransferase [Deltaproteobacteria bacterium]
MERAHIRACIVCFDVPGAEVARARTQRSLQRAHRSMTAWTALTLSFANVSGEKEALERLLDPSVDAVLLLRAGETVEGAALELFFELTRDEDDATRGAAGQAQILEVVAGHKVRRIEPRLFRRGASAEALPRVHVPATIDGGEPSEPARAARRERLLGEVTPTTPARVHMELAELFVHDDPARALEHASIAVELGEPSSPDAPRAAVALADALLAIGAADEVLALVDACARRWPRFAELSFMRFRAERARGKIDAARDALIACLERGEDDRFPGTLGAGSHLAAYELGLWLEAANDRVAARRFYQAAAPESSGAATRLQALDRARNDAAPAPIHRSEWVATRSTRHGTMSYFANDTFVGRSLDLYGEWCASETDILTALVRTGEVVVDVGANVGTLTLSLAAAVGRSGRVIAFEPQRLVHALLTTNAAMNGAFQVECVLAAVGDVTGTVDIPRCDPERACNVGAAAIASTPSAGETEPVPLMRIDDLALTSCHLLKIDAEGFEPKVLEGARRTIEAHRPFLFVENDTVERSAATLAALRALRYRAYWHVARYYRPDNWHGAARDVFAPYQPQANLVAVPIEREVPAIVRGLVPVVGDDDDFVKAIGRGALTATLAMTPVNDPAPALLPTVTRRAS